MIAFYNSNVGDVLMLIMADNEGVKLDFEHQSNIVRIFRVDTGATVAWNIFQPPSITSEKNGELQLTEAYIAELNTKLLSAGFEECITDDKAEKFVVAEIVKMEKHPDSDHLYICQVAINVDENAELTQIVCGAQNVRVGLKTVAALPGTLMPSGSLIWPGNLRGVPSKGMLCSPRELALPEASETRGIIELSEKLSVGDVFDPTTMWEN